MSRPRSIESILLMLILLTAPLAAQFEQFYENWRWAHFTTRSGLPSNYIDEVIETGDGTVWVSTRNGIAWYDGFQWQPIDIDSVHDHLSKKIIVPFHKDRVLIISSGKLYLGDTTGCSIVNMEMLSGSGVVTSVAPVDSISYIFVYETKDSTHLYKSHQGKISRIDSPSLGKVFSTRESVWVLAAGRDGYNRIYRWRQDTMILLQSALSYPNAIRSVVENKFGNGIFAIDAPKHNIGLWEYNESRDLVYSASERNQPIRALDISDNNETIVVYESGAIHYRNPNATQWLNVHPIPQQMLNTVTVKYRSNGDIWFGTENGLYLLSRNINPWAGNISTFSDLKNVVMEIFRSNNGELWVGTMDGVVVYRSDGTKESVETIDGRKIGLVTGINQDNKNNIWISSGSEFFGAYRWDGLQWKYFNVGSSPVHFHKIRRDNNGHLWFLGLGVYPGDPAGYQLVNNEWRRIDSLYSLSSNRVYAFEESRGGVKWFGTSGGLTRIKDGSTTHWGKERLGKNMKVYSLVVDSSETVWFSTFSPNLYFITAGSDSLRWQWKGDDIHNYKQKIWDLAIDHKGVLWVANTSGLYRFSRTTWSNYTYETGLHVRELRVVLPIDDRIYIGGHGIGLRSIQLLDNRIPIKIDIVKTIVEENTVFLDWEPLSFWGRIPIDQIETRYRLNSEQWSAWSTRSEIVLKEMISGDHEFIVQAKDYFGNIYEAPDAIAFRVEPPVYLRPGYISPFILMFCATIYIYYRYKKAQRLHKKILHDQRTRIANDLHDEVGSNLGSITLISQQLEHNVSIAEEVMRDIKIITRTSQETSEFLRDIVWYVNPRYDSFVNVETRLREIGERMLRGVQSEIIIVNESTTDTVIADFRRHVILMYKEILHNIIRHARASRVSVSCRFAKNRFYLTITDNGVGFNPALIPSGNGLMSLKRRAEDIGAEMIVNSNLGSGTTIDIQFQTDVRSA